MRIIITSRVDHVMRRVFFFQTFFIKMYLCTKFHLSRKFLCFWCHPMFDSLKKRVLNGLSNRAKAQYPKKKVWYQKKPYRLANRTKKSLAESVKKWKRYEQNKRGGEKLSHPVIHKCPEAQFTKIVSFRFFRKLKGRLVTSLWNDQLT